MLSNHQSYRELERVKGIDGQYHLQKKKQYISDIQQLSETLNALPFNKHIELHYCRTVHSLICNKEQPKYLSVKWEK